VSLLILTSPPAVPHRILLHLRTRAKAIPPGPTKRNLLPIHLRISLPQKAKVHINPTAAVINPTNPLTKSLLNLTAVPLTNRDLRLRTNPTGSPLLLTNHHLNLTVNHHLLTNHQNPGAVLLLIRVRQKVQEVLPPGPGLPGLVRRRAPIRKKSKWAKLNVKQFKDIKNTGNTS
jgi:hypothetical protein